jgi:hypothetical protein
MAQALDRIMRDDELVANLSQRGFDAAMSLAPTRREWGDQLVALYEEKLSSAKPLGSRVQPRATPGYATGVPYRSASLHRDVNSAPGTP